MECEGQHQSRTQGEVGPNISMCSSVPDTRNLVAQAIETSGKVLEQLSLSIGGPDSKGEMGDK